MRRLLLDQGLPRSTATVLAQAGWDVKHVADVGISRASDQEILLQAEAEQRVCVTLDADFHALLATGGQRAPSVVRVRREGLNGKELAGLLQAVWPGIADALDAGAMVTLTEQRIRVRRLPIQRR